MVLVYSIGKSTMGKELWVTRISKEVKFSKEERQKRQLLKPMIKLVCNMHGNEVRNKSCRYVKKVSYIVSV